MALAPEGLRVEPAVFDRVDAFQLPENLGFGKVLAPVMYRAVCIDGEWVERELVPYGPLSIDPAAKVLHYSQEIFEGMKAYRIQDGKPTLFRPLENFHRLNRSAHRMCMPEIDEAVFTEGVSLVTALLADHIPRKSSQSLYLRPFMIGLDAKLGLGASSRHEFFVIASPSEVYQEGCFKVMIERDHSRAAVGGTGDVKVGGNYAASLASAGVVQGKGFDQSLWLDPKERRFVEELSGMNLFAVINGEVHTPELSGSILPGITRDSLIRLIADSGYTVVERQIDVDELLSDIRSGACSEIFACGTAAVITPVSHMGDEGAETLQLPDHYPVAEAMRKRLVDIQEGAAQDPYGWVEAVADCYFVADPRHASDKQKTQSISGV